LNVKNHHVLNVLEKGIDGESDESGHRMVGMGHDCDHRMVDMGHDYGDMVVGMVHNCDDRVIDMGHDHGILDGLEKEIDGEDADVEMNYDVVVVLSSIV
jgi:hypothetical protein